MNISNKTPFLEFCQDVSEIAKPLKKLGITYFTYMKSMFNGQRIYLDSDVSILEPYLAEKYYLVGNNESKPKNYQSQTVLWDTLPNQHIFNDILIPRNIGHGIFLFEPNVDFCESFAFATTRDNHTIINTYLSNMDILKKFIQYFKDKASNIIKSAEKEKFILPFHNKQIDFVSAELDVDFINNEMLHSDRSLNIGLSPRQMECARLLSRGMTSKEIAAIIGLSPRTVEYYIDNIKIKLNCRNRTELIAKLASVIH